MGAQSRASSSSRKVEREESEQESEGVSQGEQAEAWVTSLWETGPVPPRRARSKLPSLVRIIVLWGV